MTAAETRPASVLDLIAWALAADVQSDAERRVGKWHIKAALVALALHADASTAETFVSAARIASDIGVSEWDARLLLGSLEDQRLVIVDRSRRTHRRTLAITVSAGIPTESIRGDAYGNDWVTPQETPQGTPQGTPQASLQLSDPIRSKRAALDPADARCARHAGVTHPPRCHDCRLAREDAEHRAARTTAALRDARNNCARCGGTGWIEADDGTPIEKCDHRPALEVVGE